MDLYFIFIIFMFIVCGIAEEVTMSVTQEYCNLKYVNITCQPGHVILINEALYGRMTARSRCITTPIEEYDGCKADAMSIVDMRCSGQESCHFQVTQTLNEDTQRIVGYKKCPPDVTPYLLIKHTCLRVIPQPNSVCKSNVPIALPYTHGYLSTALAGSTNLGTQYCPWRIQVPAGQFVNISVFNFYRHDIKSDKDSCNTYGTILEGEGARGKGNSIFVCNKDPRMKWIYTSTSSLVDIEFDRPSSSTRSAVVYFHVSGCPDIESRPPIQLVKRKGNQAEIICNRDGSKETLHLTCKGNEWLGRMNCSTVSSINPNGSEDLSDTNQKFPYGLVVVVAIGVALGIFFGGIMLLCVSVYMKRRYQHDGNYTRPDYDIEYNIPERGDCTYPTALIHHQHQMHDGTYPAPYMTGGIPHPPDGNVDTLLPYIRCAKHGITSPPGIEASEHFVNPNTLTQLNTSQQVIPPYKSERTNPFNLNRTRDYEHPKA